MSALRFPAALLLAAWLAACDSALPSPDLRNFAATPDTVARGQAAVLAWNVSGATSLLIDSGVGEVSGTTSIAVAPRVTTTYRLTALGPGGKWSAAEVTVTVTAGPPLPAIAQFTASPPVVSSGPATLLWSVTDATSLFITPAPGDVSGRASAQVSQAATTRYLLTATGPGGRAQASVTVAQGPPGLRLDYLDPPATAARKVFLMKNAARSTPARLVLDVVVGTADLPAAFGVAMNLPLDAARAIFDSASGIELPAVPLLDPGSGRSATRGGRQATAGPLAGLVTIGVARRKRLASDGDVKLPAGAVLFSVAFNLAAAAQDGTVFDAAILPPGARLAVLRKDGTEAASTADFAVGQLFVTR